MSTARRWATIVRGWAWSSLPYSISREVESVDGSHYFELWLIDENGAHSSLYCGASRQDAMDYADANDEEPDRAVDKPR